MIALDMKTLEKIDGQIDRKKDGKTTIYRERTKKREKDRQIDRQRQNKNQKKQVHQGLPFPGRQKLVGQKEKKEKRKNEQYTQRRAIEN